MIIDLYKEILQYQEIGGDMADRLKKMSLYEIFKPLDEALEDKTIFNSILFYIIRVYSITSSELHIGGDLLAFKKNVCKSYGFSEELTQELIYLQSQAVASVVNNYLEYQESVPFRHYMTTVDLYNQMLYASLSFIKDTNGNTDYAKKHQCHEFAGKLYQKISEWEGILKAAFGHMDSEKRMAKEQMKINKLTLSIEDYKIN